MDHDGKIEVSSFLTSGLCYVMNISCLYLWAAEPEQHLLAAEPEQHLWAAEPEQHLWAAELEQHLYTSRSS